MGWGASLPSKGTSGTAGTSTPASLWQCPFQALGRWHLLWCEAELTVWEVNGLRYQSMFSHGYV